jgi:hypothetical protein
MRLCSCIHYSSLGAALHDRNKLRKVRRRVLPTVGHDSGRYLSVRPVRMQFKWLDGKVRPGRFRNSRGHSQYTDPDLNMHKSFIIRSFMIYLCCWTTCFGFVIKLCAVRFDIFLGAGAVRMQTRVCGAPVRRVRRRLQELSQVRAVSLQLGRNDKQGV